MKFAWCYPQTTNQTLGRQFVNFVSLYHTGKHRFAYLIFFGQHFQFRHHCMTKSKNHFGKMFHCIEIFYRTNLESPKRRGDFYRTNKWKAIKCLFSSCVKTARENGKKILVYNYAVLTLLFVSNLLFSRDFYNQIGNLIFKNLSVVISETTIWHYLFCPFKKIFGI